MCECEQLFRMPYEDPKKKKRNRDSQIYLVLWTQNIVMKSWMYLGNIFLLFFLGDNKWYLGQKDYVGEDSHLDQRDGEAWFFKRKITTLIGGPFLMGEASFQILNPTLWKEKKKQLLNWILSLYSTLNCSKKRKKKSLKKIDKPAKKMGFQLWSGYPNKRIST